MQVITLPQDCNKLNFDASAFTVLAISNSGKNYVVELAKRNISVVLGEALFKYDLEVEENKRCFIHCKVYSFICDMFQIYRK